MQLFTDYTVTLSMGLLNAVVTLVSFIGILWGLSGGFAFTLGGTQLSSPGLHGLDRAALLRRRHASSRTTSAGR